MAARLFGHVLVATAVALGASSCASQQSPPVGAQALVAETTTTSTAPPTTRSRMEINTEQMKNDMQTVRMIAPAEFAERCIQAERDGFEKTADDLLVVVGTGSQSDYPGWDGVDYAIMFTTLLFVECDID